MTTKIQPPAAGQASDEELLLRYRDHRDVAAFETLVHRYERELHNYLYRYLGNASLAEEVFQLTFLRLHEKAHMFAADRPFRPWLYSLATHLAVDNLRKAGRRRAVSLNSEQVDHEGETRQLIGLLADDTPSPLAQLEASERQEWIRQAIQNLPEDMRSVVLLTYFQGLKYRETAEALGIPLGTVKSRLHKALHALNQAWKRGEKAPRGMIAMYDRLLGYMLGCLDPEESHEIEAALKTDDSLRDHLEILRRCAHPLEIDRDHVPPPKDLAANTCQRLRGLLGQDPKPSPPA